ncbi:MAG: DUF655 domain-containing protein [Halobacteriales archaeon]|nr:DUF655 domain-containing protein [Halobacteriales archaeon]
MSEDEGADHAETAIVLDYLPHGKSEDDRPQYQKPPLAHAVDESTFQLFELVLTADGGVGIGDHVAVTADADLIEEVRPIEYDDLSGGAQSELEHVVADIVAENADEYIDFYNNAGPITLRLHQLNLLPGIGDKLRDDILDHRKRQPFDDFADLETRISGLHDPQGVLVERIIEEIKDEDVKYKLFARPDEDEPAE